MAKEKDRKKQIPEAAERAAANSSGGLNPAWPPLALLLLALIAASIVYSPALRAGWFYDDNDYVLLDPRMDHLELFVPGHWHDPPPSLERPGQPPLVIPGYEKPLIADRFLWHLSFALERKLFGLKPAVAHGVNLFLHLCCIAMLFLALSALLRLYLPDDDERSADALRIWRFLPGLAALIFAVHPWAAEPVCYVSARNGSMGAFFTLTGLYCWSQLFDKRRNIGIRVAAVFGALVFALAAYGSKENFIAAPAGYVLATAPLIWRAFRSHAKPVQIGLFAAIAGAIAVVAWIGIHNSDRAAGLFAQTAGGAGWTYLFEVQSPILLMTLGDELLCRRLTLETNFPGWAELACCAGLLANSALLLWGAIRGLRKPIWLALAWFYVFLIPSNSFLPRPDFLAGRNVYLPTAGAAVLFAGGVLWLASMLRARARTSGSKFHLLSAGALPVNLAAGLCLYFGIATYDWSECFREPLYVWERSAAVSPDHAVVRLNYAVEIFQHMAKQQAEEENAADDRAIRRQCEEQLKAAIAAENSPTMRYHTERPKRMVRAIANQILGELRQYQQQPREAEEFYRKSWEFMPTVTTWVQWLNVASGESLNYAIAEGMREWPNAWWPRTARALRRLQDNGQRMNSEILDDLLGAESVPNSIDPSLRMLQAQALSQIASSITDKQRILKLLDRLKDLGAVSESLTKLREQLVEKSGPPGGN